MSEGKNQKVSVLPKSQSAGKWVGVLRKAVEVGEKYLENNPDQKEKFTNDLNEGVKYVKQIPFKVANAPSKVVHDFHHAQEQVAREYNYYTKDYYDHKFDNPHHGAPVNPDPFHF